MYTYMYKDYRGTLLPRNIECNNNSNNNNNTHVPIMNEWIIEILTDILHKTMYA